MKINFKDSLNTNGEAFITRKFFVGFFLEYDVIKIKAVKI